MFSPIIEIYVKRTYMPCQTVTIFCCQSFAPAVLTAVVAINVDLPSIPLAWETASFTRFFHAHGTDHPLRTTLVSQYTGHGRLMLEMADIRMTALPKITKLYSNT